MVAAYRISELARRSGFSASALRYYEQVGLLDPPPRTAAGYRVYDDTTLERLAFVERAKRMGLSLESIADLVRLWSGGECAPVQDRLRALLDDRHSAVSHQVSELQAFAGQLAAARSRLDQPPAVERCGDGCGCDVEVGPPVDIDIACTLNGDQVGGRVATWRALVDQAVERDATPAGIRLRFRADPELAGKLAELAVAETECCRFLSISLSTAGDAMWLHIEGPADARPVIEVLIG